jgi:hypothetical protein
MSCNQLISYLMRVTSLYRIPSYERAERCKAHEGQAARTFPLAIASALTRLSNKTLCTPSSRSHKYDFILFPRPSLKSFCTRQGLFTSLIRSVVLRATCLNQLRFPNCYSAMRWKVRTRWPSWVRAGPSYVSLKRAISADNLWKPPGMANSKPSL